MKASETTFQRMVEGEKQFVVPLYQRPYSWSEEQLSQLWADILDQADAVSLEDAGASHFLGAVVLAGTDGMAAGGLQRWMIVDGQQRLTTLMLLLCAIRDHIAADSPRDVERINEQYLTNKFQTGDSHLRLLPTQADRGSFTAAMLSTPTAGGGDTVGAALRFFAKALTEADDPADPHDIARIEKVVRERLALVEISTQPGDNVYRIFESLNNTGLGLTQADLVRNYVFMLLPKTDEQVYRTTWLPMQTALSPTGLELLMYLDLVLRGDERVRRDDLYRSHQKRLQPLTGDEQRVAGYVAELGERAKLLVQILEPWNPQSGLPEELRAGIARLNRWGSQATYPALMVLLERLTAGTASVETVSQALRYVESYLVRRMLVAQTAKNTNRIFQASPGPLRAAEDVAEGLRQYLSPTRMFWPSDGEVVEAIKHRPFYWTGRNEQRMFVLKRLEESYPSKERGDLDSIKLSIEHILPQTPTQVWFEMLAEELSDDEDPTEVAQRIMHTLGNLTITAYNPELANDPFYVKREVFIKSKLEMNLRIAEKKRWGRAEIDARAEELAHRVIELWPGPDETQRTATTSRTWQLLDEAMAALPAGAWTSYSDLAELIGSHPRPVGVHVANTSTVPNGHRVLNVNGEVNVGFHWTDPTDERDPRDVLEAEGVEFNDAGRARQEQRMTAVELATLIGMNPEELAGVDIPVASGSEEIGEREQTFLTQLGERDGPAVAGAVARLLDHWRALGGTTTFGVHETVSCFTMIEPDAVDTNQIWALALYPGSTVEVVFQYLKIRPPFDDPALRSELRRRLNEAPDIDLPLAKLELRPSFSISALTNPDTWRVVAETLEWFAEAVFGYRAAEAEQVPPSLA